MIQRRTVGIVGTGNVGVAAAYALFLENLASELILIDVDARRAEGEAMDLMHGQALAGNVAVRAGTYADLAQAQVVVITAGVGQSSPDETRLHLLNRNVAIFRQIVEALDEHAPGAIVIVATNPVDVLTYATQALSVRPHERIIGTGTLLDTSRFRALLGRHYGVDPRSVHAYILGEHGDSEVPIWSAADIGGLPLRDNPVRGHTFDKQAMERLFEDVKRAAYQIIDRKGYTNTAIGVVIARIVRAILGDERSVLPLSVRLDGEYGLRDVCLSIPCVVGLDGVIDRVLPPLAPDEHEALNRSAAILTKSRQGVDL
ncbi:MAG: L-lactate dehydrogenase [Bacteroidota bacterium]